MKTLSLFIILSVCCLNKTNGQRVLAVDTSKYSIKLPDYWKPGNAIWGILTDKLPLVCEEIRDKELCGDNCNPKYSIVFEMSEPVVLDYYPSLISSDTKTETWEISTLYFFTSSLLLLNDKKELLTRFILVDTNEVWKVKHRAKLTSYSPPPPMKIYVLAPPYQAQGNAQNEYNQSRIQTGTAGQTPFSYINKSKAGLVPTQRNMLDIIDEKIRSW